MKLVAEQVKLLREERRNAYKEIEQLKDYYNSGENSDMDDVNVFTQRDYQTDFKHQKIEKTIDSISRVLESSEFVMDRNITEVDFGTRFEVAFDEDDKDTFLMVEPCDFIHDPSFVSSNSDFGQAVLGSSEGDVVEYTVSHSGNKISVPVTAIVTDPNEYEHFIREKESKYRTSRSAGKKMALARDEKDYHEDWESVSISQRWLLKEEFLKGENGGISAQRLGLIKKQLESPVALLPQDDSIGVGSFVTIQLLFEDKEVEPQSFEMINRAFSTELESDYVERISPLGNALFGLHAGDDFIFHMDGANKVAGYVVSVDNQHNKKFEKVNIR